MASRPCLISFSLIWESVTGVFVPPMMLLAEGADQKKLFATRTNDREGGAGDVTSFVSTERVQHSF